MNFHFVPSLEHITAVKIVTTLWTRDDIKALMVNYFHEIFNGGDKKNWQKIENKVMEIELPLSNSVQLEGKITGCIKPVGLQILNWVSSHQSLAEDDVVPYLNSLAWTPYGTLDKRKTADFLIRHEAVDILTRYKLACFYCLEDDILKLWGKIPEASRKSFYDEGNFVSCFQHLIVFFWTYHIMEKLDEFGETFGRNRDLKTPYQFAFEFVANWGNKPATEYFLLKLTPRGRQQSLAKIAEYIARNSDMVSSMGSKLHEDNYGVDVICFLFSQMVEDDRIMLLQRRPHEILKYFLDWPWQSLFMETASYMWGFLRENNYYDLLEIIVDKVINGYEDFDYQNLFRDFWQSSPTAHKKYVIDECTRKSLVLKLLWIKDETTIGLILRHATNIERRNIYSCDWSKIFFEV